MYLSWIEFQYELSKELGEVSAFATFSNEENGKYCRCVSEDFGVPPLQKTMISGNQTYTDMNENLVEIISKQAKTQNQSAGRMKTIQVEDELIQNLLNKLYIFPPADGLTDLAITARHPNLLPLNGIVNGKDIDLLIWDYQPLTLQAALTVERRLWETPLLRQKPSQSRGGPKPVMKAATSEGDLRRRFFAFQLIRILDFMHKEDIVLAKLHKSIFVTPNLWIRILPTAFESRKRLGPSDPKDFLTTKDLPNRPMIENKDPSPWLEAPPSTYLPLTMRWCLGQMSNFEYLMAVNQAAGRSMGDSTFHCIFPWVSNLLVPNGGFRDLSITKFRLNKGDQQLDSTYLHGAPPHHVPESLSEITYYIYMARRTPLSVLKQVVRANFVAEHYPSSIARMFDWSPDECIPEFYSDPSAFESKHLDSGMPHLGIPSWCDSPEEFVKYHRDLLESTHVSDGLPKWLDLTFGVCLCGDQAVLNKNVPLWEAGDSGKPTGFVQLFSTPHPRRIYPEPEPKIPETTRIFEETYPLSISSEFSALLASKETKVGGEPLPAGTETPFIWLEQIGEKLHYPSDKAKMARKPSDQLFQVVPNFTLSAEGRSSVDHLQEYEQAKEFSATEGKKLEPIYYFPGEPVSKASNIFTLGCILAELYLGEPYVTMRESGGTSGASGIDCLDFKSLAGLPASVQSAVLLMTEPNAQARVTASQILTKDQSDGGNTEYQRQLLGEDFGQKLLNCTRLFPNYFDEIIDYLSSLHSQECKIDQLLMTMSRLPTLVDIPIQGFGLLLPFILDFFKHPDIFEPARSGNARSSNSLVLEMVGLVDLVAQKIGAVASSSLLLPATVSFLESVGRGHPLLQRDLLPSPVWQVFVQRFGPTDFIQKILPIVLEWLKSGPYEVKKVTAQALGNLTSPNSLGNGLCCRYVIPKLMELFDFPADFIPPVGALDIEESNQNEDIDLNHAKMQFREDEVLIEALFAASATLPTEPLIVLILERIVGTILPKFSENLKSKRLSLSAVGRPFLRILGVLHRLLSLLPPTAVLFYFVPVAKLLTTIPLPSPTLLKGGREEKQPSSFVDNQAEIDVDDQETVTFEPFGAFSVLASLGALTAAVGHRVGHTATETHLLPIVDQFFQEFLKAYGTLVLSSPTMTKALHVAREIYCPLSQLLGPERIAKLVPSASKRLVSWLERDHSPTKGMRLGWAWTSQQEGQSDTSGTPGKGDRANYTLDSSPDPKADHHHKHVQSTTSIGAKEVLSEFEIDDFSELDGIHINDDSEEYDGMEMKPMAGLTSRELAVDLDPSGQYPVSRSRGITMSDVEEPESDSDQEVENPVAEKAQPISWLMKLDKLDLFQKYSTNTGKKKRLLQRRLETRAWLLGGTGFRSLPNPLKGSKSMEKGKVGSMCIQASFPAYDSGEPVACLATDTSESLLLSAGGKRGAINVWSIKAYPIQTTSIYQGHSSTVTSIHLLEWAQRAVSCDGDVLVWDVERATTLAQCSKPTNWDYVNCQVLPIGGCLQPACEGFGTSDSGQQIAALTSNNLYHFDFRTQQQQALVANPVADWQLGGSSISELEGSDSGGYRCFTINHQGNWIAAGSGYGRISLLDRRFGICVQSWEAHDASIAQIKSLDEKHVLSVAADRTALIWDISKQPLPKQVCRIRGLPGYQSGMTSNTVGLYEWSNGQDNQRHKVLLAAAGHKMSATVIPPKGTTKVDACPQHFLKQSGDRAYKLSGNKLNIQSSIYLPLRKMIVLGCSDGNVKVSV